MKIQNSFSATICPNTVAGRLRTACAARLLLLLLLLTLPAAVQAQFTFVTNNGTITVTGYTGPGGDVVIPDTINDLPVTRVGNYAFYTKTNVTSVTIPDSVTNIGYYAFYKCTSLTNVMIGNSVTSIGYDAFYNCTSLTSITIPDSVTSIGVAPFEKCTNLTAITVDALNPAYSSVDGVLFNQSQTTLIKCPEGKAGSFTVPNTVTNLGDHAFIYCYSLTAVYFQGNAPSMGTNVFYGDNNTNWTVNVTVYYLPGTTGWGSTLGGRPTVMWDPLVPFTYRTNNGTITIMGYTGPGGAVAIPDTINFLQVTRIGYDAFYNCTSPSSVTIPNSVTNIGDYAFYYCTRLSSVTIPDSVTSIGGYAFYNCTSLTNATIGNGVTSIGVSAFEKCTNLTAIMVDALNPAYSSVDGVLFNKNQTTLIKCPETKAGSFTVPNTVTNIGDHAFIYCYSLMAVYFQSNAPSMGTNVFYGDTTNGTVNVTVYYLSGTTGWGTTFGGRPTKLWNPHFQVGDACFGVRTNRFGFNITGTANIPIVVEACTNLANSAWVPLQSCTLTNGSVYFSDPDWTNHPGRFYRLRSP